MQLNILWKTSIYIIVDAIVLTPQCQNAIQLVHYIRAVQGNWEPKANMLWGPQRPLSYTMLLFYFGRGAGGAPAQFLK